MQFVVIDFEATCDEPYNPDPQEIIEFPGVVVELDSEFDTNEFHAFVRPAAHPLLTPFCTNLTGIQQDQVDGATIFPDVLRRFESWLQALGRFPRLLVTCGDWDLGSLLPRQCAQHNLPIPEWANRWVNVKRIFTRYFRRASGGTGLGEMTARFGLPLAGRLHSGIDDARNIAAVLRRMLEMGVTVENTRRTRGSQSVAVSSIPLKRGDWLCSRCGEHNFARRRDCYKCGSSR